MLLSKLFSKITSNQTENGPIHYTTNTRKRLGQPLQKQRALDYFCNLQNAAAILGCARRLASCAEQTREGTAPRQRSSSSVAIARRDSRGTALTKFRKNSGHAERIAKHKPLRLCKCFEKSQISGLVQRKNVKKKRKYVKLEKR